MKVYLKKKNYIILGKIFLNFVNFKSYPYLFLLLSLLLLRILSCINSHAVVVARHGNQNGATIKERIQIETVVGGRNERGSASQHR